MNTKQEEGTDVLLKYLHDRFKRKKTTTVAISGSLGSGKSYSSLRIAELWYDFFFKEKFPLDNCCFSIKEMMDRFNKGKLRKGELLILEETGVAIASKNFMSKINRFFNYYMQSFRSKQILVIFNLPVFSLMDKSTRILINANFITQQIDNKNKLCELKPFFHQLNQQTGKIYPKYLRKGVKRGKYTFQQKINLVKFMLPDIELIKKYEMKKDKFVTELGLEISMEFEKEEGKKKVIYGHECKLCNYKWEGVVEKPKKCPVCNKRNWDNPPIEAKPLGNAHISPNKPLIAPI